jgi:alcohol dehydrogenase
MALADQTFGFFMPPVSLMGVGSSKQAGVQAKSLGITHALVVTDEKLFKLGVADTIKNYLTEAGVKVSIFHGAEPHPTETNVADGVAAFKKNKCDGLVSLGGGSSHDCCKGVGLVVSNGGQISDYAGADKATKPLPPYVSINTTAGTGSEMSRFAVITNPQTRVKWVICDWRITSTVAINDPVLMIGMPPGMTAATGMDALAHAVEAYVTNVTTPVTDACAIKAIELVAKYLRPAVANGQNLKARDGMAYAEFLAGMAFNSALLGYVHAIAHQPGGKFNLPHGVCNAICLPVVCEFNLIACPERFADIARAMGEDIHGLTAMEAGAKGIAAIRSLSKEVGIPSGLAFLGVKESDLPALAENAMKDLCALFNPRPARLQDVIDMYRQAMGAPYAKAAAAQ